MSIALAAGSSSPVVRNPVHPTVLARVLRSASCMSITSGGKMSSLDRVVPQATQLPLLNRMVEMIVIGEDDPTWLQRKIGFKSARNVYYYLEAARWARLVDEDELYPTTLGRRYVMSGFDPCVVLEGLRGRTLFEEVMRVTQGDVPTPEVVARVLRCWSFRYSKGTVARRARDFCTLFGRIIADAATQKVFKLVVKSEWVDPPNIQAIAGVATLWPALEVTPIWGLRRSKNDTSTHLDVTQLCLPFKEDA